MDESRWATGAERWLLDDPDNPRGAQPFEFPFGQEFPVRDPLAGIALGDGGSKGSFHVGVVHALVMTGYYPTTIAGTSIGSISAAVLALAAERDDQAGRRALVERYVGAWLDGDPGGSAWSVLLGPGAPLRTMLDTLVALPRSLDEVARVLGARSAGARAYWGARLLARLPSKRRSSLLRAFARHAWRRLSRRVRAEAFDPSFRHGDETLGSVLFPEGIADVAQVALDAFGMPDSLSQKTLDVSPFAPMLLEAMPDGGDAPIRSLTRSRLVLEAANVSSFDEGLRAPRLVTLDGAARLWPAIRASCAAVPLFPAERLREVFPGDATPEGCLPDDLLVDGSLVQHAPLTQVLNVWRRDRAGDDPWSIPSHRLFVVYTGPRDVTAEHRGPDDPPPALFQAALRSLRLWGQEDLQFNARVVSLITQMIRAVRRAKKSPTPPPDDALLDRSGNPAVPVDCTTIAPDDLLPMEAISAPTRAEYNRAMAQGCRATLEALHAATLKTLADDGGTVPCGVLLDALAGKGVPRGEGYLRPVDAVCGGCTGRLRARPVAERHGHVTGESVDAMGALDDGGARGPIDIVVPAGGVFRGVFQIGAIAAFNDYGLAPRLYAGASVGTIFSYLLHASTRSPRTLFEAVRLMQTIPDWFDRAAGGGGRVAELADRLTGRWRARADLRNLSPAALVAALGGDDESPAWGAVADALDLPPGRRPEVRDGLRALTRGRLGDAVSLLDDRVDAWGVALRGHDGAMPELLGLDRIEDKLRSILFGGDGGDDGVDLDAYARRSGTRFLFTVTDHDRGVLVHFGAGPHAVNGEASAGRWPLALQASLAASSFPLAFRLRTQRELFGVGRPEGGGVGSLYADGGLLNNFPSDSAFAYLRALASRPGAEWISEHRHRVLLLSLTEPPRVPGGDPLDASVVAVSRRARITAEADKVHRTLVTQQQINRVARHANPALRLEAREMRAAGRPESAVAEVRPAICVDFVHIAPAQPGYAHPFAFNEALGFDLRVQNASIAGGCRRARLALEWGRVARDDLGRPVVTVEEFERRVRAEIEAEVRPLERRHCVLGTFNPEGRRRPCAFVDRPEGSAPDVYRACCDTALDDVPMRDLPGRYAEPV